MTGPTTQTQSKPCNVTVRFGSQDQAKTDAKPGEFGTPPTSPAKYTANCLTKRGKLRKVLTVEEANARAANARAEGHAEGRRSACRAIARTYDFFSGVDSIEGVQKLAAQSWDEHAIKGFVSALAVLDLPVFLRIAVGAAKSLREAQSMVAVFLKTRSEFSAAVDKAFADAKTAAAIAERSLASSKIGGHA